MTTALDSQLEKMGSGAVAWKRACRVATTANITLSGLQTIDGVALSSGDRVLVKDQSSAAQNGIYTALNGGWTRTLDLSSGRYAHLGMVVPVLSGTVGAGSWWQLTSPVTGSITLGVTSLTFTKVRDAGAAYAAADGVDGSNIEDASAASKLVLQTAAGISGFEAVRTKEVSRKTAGTLRVEGEAGVVCGDGATDVCTISYPSASIGQIQGAQTIFRLLNAESSGQVNLRSSSSTGSVILDGAAVAMRDYGANYDYLYFLNKWTSLPTPGSAISIHGYLFPDLSGNAPNGQIRFYGKQKVWEELTCQDMSGSTATSKRILRRMARLTSSTAAIKDVLTIAASDLPSGDWSARIMVEWMVFSVTEGATAGGFLMATIERAGGTTAVMTAAADQIIGVMDNSTASIDTTTDTPRIVASSGNIITRVEVTNTDDVRLAARVVSFWIVEH